MKVVRRSDVEAEITAVDKENREWRYPVDIAKETCSCKQWQVKGLPCIHALYFITSLRGPVSEIEPYVHEFYSVAKFKAAYADNIPAMVGKQQWDIVDPGFKLQAPVLRRPKGRSRKTRIRSSAEGVGLGPRKRKCKRCGGFGHIARICKNPVDPAFGEDEADLHAGDAPFVAGEGDPEPSVVASSVGSRKSVKKKTEKKTNKRKNKEDEHSTRTEGSTSGSVASPMHTRVAHKSPDSPAQNTRSKKRLHM
ncbi:hypothetical protein ACQJBY_066498 [Aegilops geniculata]